MVDATCLLLKDEVGLLTASRGPGGAGDVVGVRHLTLSGGLLSLGCGSLGGSGSCGGFIPHKGFVRKYRVQYRKEEEKKSEDDDETSHCQQQRSRI